jgi:hypothetical protein
VPEFLPEFREREGKKDVVAVIVQDPEVVRLLQILDNHPEMIAVALLTKLYGDFET